MGMKDDLQKVRAMEIRSLIAKLRREAGEGQSVQGENLLPEILEAVGQLEDDMKEVKERLDRLENPSGS